MPVFLNLLIFNIKKEWKHLNVLWQNLPAYQQGTAGKNTEEISEINRVLNSFGNSDIVTEFQYKNADSKWKPFGPKYTDSTPMNKIIKYIGLYHNSTLRYNKKT